MSDKNKTEKKSPTPETTPAKKNFIDPIQLSNELKRKLEIKMKRVQELELALPKLDNFANIESGLKTEIGNLGAELSALLIKRFESKENIFLEPLKSLLQSELNRLRPPKDDDEAEEGKDPKKPNDGRKKPG